MQIEYLLLFFKGYIKIDGVLNVEIKDILFRTISRHRYIFSLKCSTIKFKSKFNFLFHINMQFIQKHEIRIKRPSCCKAHFYTLKQFSLCGGVITMKPCISWSAFHNIGNHFWLSVVTLSIFFLYCKSLREHLRKFDTDISFSWIICLFYAQ